jgi:hypothetical protein
MKYVPLAGFAGAIVVFSWNMVSWMATPLHERSVRALTDEASVVQALRSQDVETGFYVVPGLPAEHAAWTQAEHETRLAQWLERHRQGPLVSIFVSVDGAEPMTPTVLVTGFVIDFIAASFAAFILWLSLGRCQDYLARVGLVALLGVFAATVCHLSYWNWMRFPLDHTLAMFVDVVVSWILAGLIIGALIRPVPSTAGLVN